MSEVSDGIAVGKSRLMRDTSNTFLVSATPDRQQIIIHRTPAGPMSRSDALNMAAWLVAMAEDPSQPERFMQEFMDITQGDLPLLIP